MKQHRYVILNGIAITLFFYPEGKEVVFMSNFSNDFIRNAVDNANRHGLNDFMFQEPCSNRGRTVEGRRTSRDRHCTSRRRCSGHSRVWRPGTVCIRQQNTFRFNHCRTSDSRRRSDRDHRTSVNKRCSCRQHKPVHKSCSCGRR